MFKKLGQVVTVGDRVTHQVHPGVLNTLNNYTVDPPNTAALGTGEKTAVLENSGKGSHIIYKQEKKYSGLEN